MQSLLEMSTEVPGGSKPLRRWEYYYWGLGVSAVSYFLYRNLAKPEETPEQIEVRSVCCFDVCSTTLHVAAGAAAAAATETAAAATAVCWSSPALLGQAYCSMLLCRVSAAAGCLIMERQVTSGGAANKSSLAAAALPKPP